MEKLKEIIDCSIVLLPSETKNTSKIGELRKFTYFIGISTEFFGKNGVKFKIPKNAGNFFECNITYGDTIHLYFTSERKLETDGYVISKDGTVSFISPERQGESLRIEATTDIWLDLPPIPQHFLEKYVLAECLYTKAKVELTTFFDEEWSDDGGAYSRENIQIDIL